jgi:hypothetical protein
MARRDGRSPPDRASTTVLAVRIDGRRRRIDAERDLGPNTVKRSGGLGEADDSSRTPS